MGRTGSIPLHNDRWLVGRPEAAEAGFDGLVAGSSSTWSASQIGTSTTKGGRGARSSCGVAATTTTAVAAAAAQRGGARGARWGVAGRVFRRRPHTAHRLEVVDAGRAEDILRERRQRGAVDIRLQFALGVHGILREAVNALCVMLLSMCHSRGGWWSGGRARCRAPRDDGTNSKPRRGDDTG